MKSETDKERERGRREGDIYGKMEERCSERGRQREK